MSKNKKKRVTSISLTEDVFTKIYKSNIWRREDQQNLQQPFYSGPGSYGVNANQYVALITDFISQHNLQSVSDIGCGDFAIGQKIVNNNPGIRYNGCDVVKDLIAYNSKTYGTDLVKFYNIDAAKDPIPAADLLTIRQVFQHLSNNDISRILENIKGFKYIIITEHLLMEGLEECYNKDKNASEGFRLTEGSGVYLNQPPFNIPWQELLSCPDNIYIEDPMKPLEYILKEAYIKSFLIEMV